MARPRFVEIRGVKIQAMVLSPGEAKGPLLVLAQPLSFWGAFDPATGTIIDIHHPQHGECLTGRIILMSETRGSGSASGTIAEAIRRSTAPLAIILLKPDVNLAIGSFIAVTLYQRQCPILSVDKHDYDTLIAATHIAIAEDGTIETG
jgi:predicted aconitase with swiveling domain